MKRFFGMSSCLVAIALAGATLSADDAKEEKGTKIESKLSKDGKKDACRGACTVNFAAELPVSFDYLSKLGSRIHDACNEPDPVELYAAAKSLEVAEKVSGKTASVTSKQVMDSAIRLAKLRREPQELKALALLVSDEGVSKQLGQAATEAEAEKPEPGEKSKAIHGTLRVINHTHHHLRIYCDGWYLGNVWAGHTTHFHVNSCRNPNELDAYCASGGEQIQHAHVWGHNHFAYWHIHE